VGIAGETKVFAFWTNRQVDELIPFKYTDAIVGADPYKAITILIEFIAIGRAEPIFGEIMF